VEFAAGHTYSENELAANYAKKRESENKTGEFAFIRVIRGRA